MGKNSTVFVSLLHACITPRFSCHHPTHVTYVIRRSFANDRRAVCRRTLERRWEDEECIVSPRSCRAGEGKGKGWGYWIAAVAYSVGTYGKYFRSEIFLMCFLTRIDTEPADGKGESQASLKQSRFKDAFCILGATTQNTNQPSASR